jgi:HSP20 family molecular chaperone IbpA
MQQHDSIRNQTATPPIVIRTTGLSAEAKELFDSIARRAYEIFESEGRVPGHALDDWLQAEAELFQRAPLKITESREGVTVQADVRGFAPKVLEVDLEPRRVTIIGKRYNTAKRSTDTGNSSESLTTELLRTMQLPVEIDTRHATARLKRGILELDMKKTIAWKASKAQSSSPPHPN